jgi:soluble lytic murein transglycosylase-like protein
MKLARNLLALTSLALLASCMHARETALLRSGFSISHDHHEQQGATTRLFLTTSDEQFVDVPTDSILSFEKDETPDVPPQQNATFTGPSSAELNQIVEKAARENQLDSDFVHAVIRAESNGNAKAVSRKGAQGLMQLMPQTANKLGVKNSFDPTDNVSAGTKYLRALLARYNNDPLRALAAYNAGAGRVEQYNGVPPYRETRAYIASIIRDFNHRKMEQEQAAKLAKKSAHPAQVKHSLDSN